MSLELVFFWLGLTVMGATLMAVLLLAAEGGFRLGRRVRKNADDPTRSQFTAIEGAALALVGLLLAFTFNMAVSRFENRKQIVINESNAIGTAYLRARLLPPSECREVQSCLRRYVDVWLDLYAAGSDVNKHKAALKELDDLQERLWSRAVAAAERNPNAVTMSLLLQSLNEVFDRQAELMAAATIRVPSVVLGLLVVAAAISVAKVGYGCGLAAHRNFVATLALSVLLAATIVVIVDFDRPRRGLIQLSPQSMVVLRESMR